MRALVAARVAGVSSMLHRGQGPAGFSAALARKRRGYIKDYPDAKRPIGFADIDNVHGFFIEKDPETVFSQLGYEITFLICNGRSEDEVIDCFPRKSRLRGL